MRIEPIQIIKSIPCFSIYFPDVLEDTILPLEWSLDPYGPLYMILKINLIEFWIARPLKIQISHKVKVIKARYQMWISFLFIYSKILPPSLEPRWRVEICSTLHTPKFQDIICITLIEDFPPKTSIVSIGVASFRKD